MFLARSVRPSTNLLAKPTFSYRLFIQRRSFADAYKPSPAIVKQLRDETGSPLKDCLKALTETMGDMTKSKEMLRKRGLADAEKRSDRMSTQGLIGVAEDANHVTMIQLSCETDFVAKTDRFRDGLDEILASVHADKTLRVLMDKTNDEAVINDICSSIKLCKNLDPDCPTKQTILEGIKFTISKT
jgi:elongation factor Ts